GHMTERLPRGVQWLLRSTVPGDLFDSIAGDLLEARRASRVGTRRGTVAICWQAVRIATSFTWERILRERRLPPIAEETRRSAMRFDSVRQDAGFAVRL